VKYKSGFGIKKKRKRTEKNW